MDWKLTKKELRVNYEPCMNITMNEHSSCESGVYDTYVINSHAQ